MRLKVEKELDKLRGEFRQKEAELISPLLSKYSQIEQRIEAIKESLSSRMADHEQALMIQEQTIEIMLNSIQSQKITGNEQAPVSQAASNC